MPSLRQQLRSSRRSLSHCQQQSAAEQISLLLSVDTDVIAARHIAFYLPNDGEIDCGLFMTRCQELGKQLYLPVVSDDESQPLLLFQRFIPGTTPLFTNRYNISEPPFNIEACVKPTELDIVFCPLVGFDRQGNRLGMGKGYYDRTFAPTQQGLEKPLLIGLAHSIQETRLTPNPWDIPLDVIYTEREKIMAE